MVKTIEIAVSDTAAKAVELDFNPTGHPQAAKLKTLAAAFITECETIRDGAGAISARRAALAITDAEAAAMWGVKAIYG